MNPSDPDGISVYMIIPLVGAVRTGHITAALHEVKSYRLYMYCILLEKLLIPQNNRPAHIGAAPPHTPLTLDPSPPQVLVLLPSRKNPSLHVCVAVVPKSNRALLSGLYVITPLVIGLRVEHVIAVKCIEGKSY